jgi:hypothetical protein
MSVKTGQAHSGGVWFCDDDLCDRFTDVSGGPLTIDGFGTASVGVDGRWSRRR